MWLHCLLGKPSLPIREAMGSDSHSIEQLVDLSQDGPPYITTMNQFNYSIIQFQ